MKIARIMSNGIEFYAEERCGKYYPIEGDIFGKFIVLDKAVEGAVELLCPVNPTKIVCFGVNYASHREEMKHDMDMEPVIFLKPTSALAKPYGNIVYPKRASVLHYEAELAIVIKKTCHKVSAADALDYVFGYTAANDVSERNFQKKDGQWTRAKGYDTFCPLGSTIAVGVDADQVQVETYLNGVCVQSGNTRDLIYDVPHAIEFVSEVMTLNPGDVILTGTPKGVGEIKPGDKVEIRIQKVTDITSFVVSE